MPFLFEAEAQSQYMQYQGTLAADKALTFMQWLQRNGIVLRDVDPFQRPNWMKG